MTEQFNPSSQLFYDYPLLKDLMDHIPDVIYFKDRQGKLLMVNQAHAKGLGLKPEEVVGKTDFDFFPKAVAEKMTQDDQKVMTSGKPMIDKIERGTDPNGLDNYVSTTKIPRFGADGKVIGLIGITRDITNRMKLKQTEKEKNRIKKKLEALKAVNKLKSDFVSEVSHELRTPLAIIKEAISLISDCLAGPITDKQKNLLTKASSNANRLQHIIDELLDISRIETGKLRLHYSLVNLTDLILDSSDYFKKSARAKGIHLRYHLTKEEVNIFVDAGRVLQVVNNLIDNALKFTPEGGRISVELKILEDKVRVVVSDTGTGIDKQNLSKLFHKFVQVSKVSGAEKKGVGLGLSIVKELVKKHGGEIWAESKPGAGSKFYFTLPRHYTIKKLEKPLREKINAFLRQGVTVYLINLAIVHFREIRSRIRIGPKKLIHDLQGIINETFRSALHSDSSEFEIVGSDSRRGEFSVIFPNATEEKAVKIYVLLKYKIENYFVRNKIKNVFINISRLPYLLKSEFDSDQEAMGNLFIKKIYIGIERRRQRRAYYRVEMDIAAQNKQTEKTQTLDISKGGVCFLTAQPLEADKLIEIKLKLPPSGKSVLMKGRVAWIKRLEEISGQSHQYKVGVEFLNLKSKSFIKHFSQIQPALTHQFVPRVQKTIPKVGVEPTTS